jgi:hypothetical protein
VSLWGSILGDSVANVSALSDGAASPLVLLEVPEPEFALGILEQLGDALLRVGEALPAQIAQSLSLLKESECLIESDVGVLEFLHNLLEALEGFLE